MCWTQEFETKRPQHFTVSGRTGIQQNNMAARMWESPNAAS